MLGQAFGVKTSGGLVSPFYDTTWVFIVRILHFFDTSRVQVFEDIFIFDAIQVYTPSKILHS